MPHRTQYSYHLTVDGNFVERHDFDPDLQASLRHHKNVQHAGKALHIPSTRITLVELVEQCWGVIMEVRGEIE